MKVKLRGESIASGRTVLNKIECRQGIERRVYIKFFTMRVVLVTLAYTTYHIKLATSSDNKHNQSAFPL